MTLRDIKVEVYPDQSYSLALRDALLAAAQRLPAFDGFTTRKTRQLPIQADDLPSLGASLVDENRVPDGDGNAGDLGRVVIARLGFSAVIVNNDPEASEATLDRLFMAFVNRIWRNPYLTSFVDTHDPRLGAGSPLNARFEAMTRESRRFVFGVMGAKNETPIAELQYEVSLLYREDYTPTIEDELLEIAMKTAIGFPEHEKIQQVEFPIRFMRPKKEDAHG
jgi:hypothetical protein